MATKEWAVFMNIMRIVTFVIIAFAVYYLVDNIEAVKVLGNDPCRVCMNMTECQCACGLAP